MASPYSRYDAWRDFEDDQDNVRRLLMERRTADEAAMPTPDALGDGSFIDGDDERQDDAVIDDPEAGETRLRWA